MRKRSGHDGGKVASYDSWIKNFVEVRAEQEMKLSESREEPKQEDIEVKASEKKSVLGQFRQKMGLERRKTVFEKRSEKNPEREI